MSEVTDTSAQLVGTDTYTDSFSGSSTPLGRWPGEFLDNFGIMFGSFWYQFWDQIGIIWGSFWDHVRIILV